MGEKSHYYCFACHRSGPLPALISSLCFLTGKDNLKARQFITRHEYLGLEPYERDDEKLEPLATVSNAILDRFDPVSMESKIVEDRCITQAAIDHWQLRWDASERRLIFPVFTADNRLVGFRGRHETRDHFLKTREYKELQASEGSLSKHGIWYGMNHLTAAPTNKVILVEGELDAVSLSIALKMRGGIWASFGSSLSGPQIAQIQALRQPVVLFFDDDEAGINAKRKLLSKLQGVKPGIFEVTNYVRCNDPDAIVRAGKLRVALKSIRQVG